MRISLFFLAIILVAVNLFAASESPIFVLVDNPTCGNYFRGQYEIRARMEPAGGVLSGIYIGITDNFSIGVSYGGDHIVGYGAVKGYKYPGVEVRYRAFEETLVYPAIAFGFCSQGHGPQMDGRYRIKSKGFYGVASKNYELYGNLSFHGGINYSLEHSDGNRNLDVFLGFEKMLTDIYSFDCDYDFAFNEGIDEYRENGYLNAGIKGYFAPNIVIEFDVRNILETGRDGINRVLKLGYLDSF